VNKILDATRLSASSMGIQPYSILVIDNEELRKQMNFSKSNLTIEYKT
jgi:nitroreductase